MSLPQLYHNNLSVLMGRLHTFSDIVKWVEKCTQFSALYLPLGLPLLPDTSPISSLSVIE